MTLHFDQFGMVTLVGSVLLVSFIVLKGKTNYLEGAILCACFAAISYVLNTLFWSKSQLSQCWGFSLFADCLIPNPTLCKPGACWFEDMSA
jgi:hypothetical protein